MKYLKLYESYKKHLDLAVKISKEICYELEDDGYDVYIQSSSVVPFWARDYIKRGDEVLHRDQRIIITISKLKYWFEYDDVKDVCERLIEVLGNSAFVSTELSDRHGFTLEKTGPEVYHYWRSNRFGGELINIYGVGMYARRSTNGNIIPGTFTKKDCLKTEIKLTFKN